MNEARSKPGLLWPTLLTVVGLAILLSLGTWQMRRLAWKEALIERVEARAKAAPVSLGAALGTYTASVAEGAAEALEFTRVTVTGKFRHEGEFHVWSPGKRGPAWSVVTPLEVTDSEAGQSRYPRTVLVIRGVVPDGQKSATARTAGNPAGEVTLTGRVRMGRVGAFSNPGSADKNEWYELDIEAMRRATAAALVSGSASGDGGEAAKTIAPFYLEAETATGGPGGPQPDLAAINLTNRHLEYALTWYGLAATLAAVFAAYLWSRRRRQA